MEEGKLVMIFGGAKQTVKAERAVKEAGFDARSIPTPLWLSLNCGIVLLIHSSDREAITNHLASLGIECEDVQPLKGPKKA